MRRPLGWLIHNTHRWSALLFFVTVTLHALRVWIGQAYLFPRDINWWAGLGLLLLTIFFGGTGYLLRWDIKAFALMDLVVSSFTRIPLIGNIIVAGMLGGAELNVIPLHRGYALHVWFLPFVLALMVVIHLFVAWRQGLAERALVWERWKRRISVKARSNFLPALGLLAFVLLLALVTPHEGQAGPVERSPWPHPDWLLVFYFLPFWHFQSGARIVGALILPAAILVLLVISPMIAARFRERMGKRLLALIGLVGVVWLFLQMGSIGSQIPLQGCTACHREGILGGAPTELSSFKIYDPDWLVFHLKQPQESIVTPYEAPRDLP
jgi:quinol-cytochrome oxidoreductase complex cytochrome b subunit